MTPVTHPLEFRNLSVAFNHGGRTLTVVDNVSLQLEKGEILAIVGESGSGKSLTARTVLGLEPDNAITSGEVILQGRDVLKASASELRKIRGSDAAMIFQEPSSALNPLFQVGWQIEEGLRAHGMTDAAQRRALALDMLRSVEIPDPERRIDYFPHQLSGGQKQRVVIAMALALDPSVIIADEPTTALDVTVQAEILALLRKCRDERDTSIILITHNMGVVADLADRVAVMYQGRVVELAPVHDLFARPQHAYTRKLLAAVPKLSGATAQIAEPDDSVPEADTLIRLENLEVTFGRGRSAFHAVRGVSFEIRRDKVFGLVGESGSGKSTLARSLVGLSPVSDGKLTMFGQEFSAGTTRLPREMRRKIGFVFQDPATSFNPHMTVFECIAEPMRMHGLDRDAAQVRKRVEELLDQVQLARSMAGRYPYELSGGQRQRVGIARALALKPELVIADEPTSALDVSVQARVLDMFQELQSELGFGALFISHDLSVVEQVSDSVGVLKNGLLVESGSADQVLNNPQDAYTRRLVNAVPIPDPVQQAELRARRLLADAAPA